MCLKPTLVTFLACLPLLARADPATELREAVSALARTTYTWETTTRHKLTGNASEARPNPSSPLEVQGKFDPNGYTQLTMLPSRELPVAVTAILRMGDVVALTPMGWLRRTEIRQTPGPDRTVAFEGEQVRLTRAFKVALKVTTLQPFTEDLFNLVADLKSCREADGLIVGELPDRVIEQLWGSTQAKRAPEIRGTATFKLSQEGVTECHLAIAMGFPHARTKKIEWTTQQWSTRVREIGSTRVEPPAEAVRALER